MCRGRGPPAAGGRCPTAPLPQHRAATKEGTWKVQTRTRGAERARAGAQSPPPRPHQASRSGWEAWASFSFIPGQGLGPCALVSEANAERPEEACDGETLKPFAHQTEAGHLRGADHGPGAAAHGRQAPLGGGPGVQWGRREGNGMPWRVGMPRDPRARPLCAPMAGSVTSSSLAVVPRGSHRPPRVHMGKLRPRPVSHRPRPPAGKHGSRRLC